jgi:hypothetical protein
MAQTRVMMKLNHTIEIGNVDVEIEVRDGKALIGTLTLSTGTIDWRRKGAHHSIKKNWSEFSDLMKNNP